MAKTITGLTRPQERAISLLTSAWQDDSFLQSGAYCIQPNTLNSLVLRHLAEYQFHPGFKKSYRLTASGEDMKSKIQGAKRE